MESVRTTLNLPAGLFKEAKLAAVHQNTTFTQLVIRGLQQALHSENDPVTKPSLHSFLKKRTPLPRLTDSERESRYRKYLEQKYG